MAILMSIEIELSKCVPFGMWLGAMGGFGIEFLRQLELDERPLNNLNFDDDEERTDLLSMSTKNSSAKSFENFIL